MKALLAACFAVFLGGCASTSSISPALTAMDNLTFEADSYGNQFVSSATYGFDGAVVKGDALPLCVVQNVQNRSVTLQDSSNQTFIPFVGVVSQDSAREVGGGQVIRYVSEDKRTVLATGAAEYQPIVLLMPVKKSVRFNLAAKAENNGVLSIVFDHIEQAQLETGSLSNDGYNKLGAWSTTSPELAIGELKKVADSIGRCVKSQ